MSLIGLVTLLTLVSCGGGGGSAAVVEDDLQAIEGVTDDTTPISFTCGLAESQTVVRSGSMLSAERGAFKVWGHKDMSFDDKDDVDPSNDEYGDMQTVFPGYTVSWVTNTAYTTTSNTNDWEYVGGGQTIKFWDWSAKAYRFFAVTDWGEELPVSPVTGKAYEASKTSTNYDVKMLIDISPVYDDEDNYDAEATAAKMDATPYFSHLWFSTGNASLYPDKQFGKPVTLEFLKPLTRVRYIYKYAFPREGYFIGTQSFAPSDGTTKIARKGTVTIIYPLTGTDTKESFATSVDVSEGYLTAFTVDYDPEDDGKTYSSPMTDDGWYIVAPNMSQGSYKLSVNINGVEKTAAVPANYMQWLPGYSYTYVFKITEEGGVEIGWVEAAVIPWIEQEADHPVYNW